MVEKVRALVDAGTAVGVACREVGVYPSAYYKARRSMSPGMKPRKPRRAPVQTHFTIPIQEKVQSSTDQLSLQGSPESIARFLRTLRGGE